MSSFRISNRVSKLFQPVAIIPKDAIVKNREGTSKSQRLMLDLGIIRQASPGSFHYLPLGVRILEKLTKLIDSEMKEILAQKVILPTLTNAKLWDMSGRMREAETELFKVQDRHKNLYLLSPTHEEAASDLLASLSPLSYKHFPLRLYQITSKYRDEMKPRFGLIRGRQFIMKDLYTFDVDMESAQNTYETVCNTYSKIFQRIGIDYMKVLGTSGNMGGSVSHEFHYAADVGEDELLCCNCGYSGNVELCGSNKCPKCGQTDGINKKCGIEVGHTFLLGEKYSKPLKATFLSADKKPVALQMGSYGLGVSRIIAAAVEVLALEHEIRWPHALAPYSVIIIPPKEGSKEEQLTANLGQKLYNSLEALPQLTDDVLLDDRTSMTIGRRALDARRVGYPVVVVVGKRATETPPMFEVIISKSNSQLYLTESELLNHLKQQFF